MDKKNFIAFTFALSLLFVCATTNLIFSEVTPQETANRIKAAEDNARQVLKGQEWTIYVVPEGGRGSEIDVITFSDDGKVSSKNLSVKGYGDSNYRITLPDGLTVVWETMKVDADKNIVFLRGELRGNEMNGSIFFKPVRGSNSTLLFSTSQAKAAIYEASVLPKKGKR